MTVDMLAATFFWPEAMVLGAEQRLSEPAGRDPEPEGAPDGIGNDAGFWAAVRRLFAGPTSGQDAAVQA